MPDRQERAVLIDGHSIINRAFYGVPPLTDGQGRPTNAVLGFLNILFKVIDEEGPAYLAVAFDVDKHTFRHEMYADYKGKRKPFPPELHAQIGMVRELLAAMNITVMELPGYEADDVIGTVAARQKAAGRRVSIISGDRDLLQLADEDVCVRIPSTSRGKTTVKDYYPGDVEEAWGVTPKEFIDVKALMGDSSDNIGGVPGIGEKGAVAIISQWHSIENAYANIEEVEPRRAREALREHYEAAVFSKKLVTIVTDAPADEAWTDCALGDIYTPEAYALVKGYGLKALSERFSNHLNASEAAGDQTPGAEGRPAAELSRPASRWEAEALIAEACGADITGISAVYMALPEGGDHGRMEEITGFALYDGKHTLLISETEDINRAFIIESLLKVNAQAHTLACFGYKRLLRALPGEAFEEACVRAAALPVAPDYFPEVRAEGAAEGGAAERAAADSDAEPARLPCVLDLSVANYLLDPLKNSYEADDVAAGILDETLPSLKERFGKADPAQLLAEGDPEACIWYMDEAVTAYRAALPAWEKLAAEGMGELYTQIELPQIVTLARMEAEGVLVLKDELAAYGNALSVRIDELEQQIYEAAGGMPFNINSTKQLGDVLFVRLGIPGGKKTKTGWSTAADVLEKLAEEWPIAGLVLEYRTYTKLKSTYADGLAGFIRADGRIHSRFHQTVTATGRISSSDPNLQNIPVRMELGRQIRKVFAASEGCRFVDADYSQIELRVLAHLSGDEALIEAYTEAQDIHAITASKVFHVPLAEVTPEQRRNAKAVNFGIVYGISAFGLSSGLSISRAEAMDYIDEYFRTYPKVKAFIDFSVERAKKHGYALTMAGRRRPIPELKSSNFMTRSFGERAAMNSPVQGSAADIIKIAMNRVERRLRAEGLKARLVLQIHDELLVEAPEDEVGAVRGIIEEEMEAAVTLAVRLEADVHDGKTWDEAK